jgi:hypothetical protein
LPAIRANGFLMRPFLGRFHVRDPGHFDRRIICWGSPPAAANPKRQSHVSEPQSGSTGRSWRSWRIPPWQRAQCNQNDLNCRQYIWSSLSCIVECAGLAGVSGVHKQISWPERPCNRPRLNHYPLKAVGFSRTESPLAAKAARGIPGSEPAQERRRREGD